MCFGAARGFGRELGSKRRETRKQNKMVSATGPGVDIWGCGGGVVRL